VIAAAGTAVILALVQATLGAKAGVREQLSGLDLSEHGEKRTSASRGRPPRRVYRSGKG